MCVKFADGTVLDQGKAAKIFVDTVKKLGVMRCKEAVENLGLLRGSMPIIYQSPKAKTNVTQFNIGNDFWLITDYTNEEKKDFIIKIADYLHEDVRVEVFIPEKPEKPLPKPKNENPNNDKTKGPQQGLKVIFPNGKIVEKPKVVDTYCETIMQIGLDRVFEVMIDHDITLNGINIITDFKHPKYGDTQRALGHGWWLMTHSNTTQKKEVLDKISHHLGLGLKIEMYEKTDKTAPKGGLFGDN